MGMTSFMERTVTIESGQKMGTIKYLVVMEMITLRAVQVTTHSQAAQGKTIFTVEAVMTN